MPPLEKVRSAALSREVLDRSLLYSRRYTHAELAVARAKLALPDGVPIKILIRTNPGPFTNDDDNGLHLWVWPFLSEPDGTGISRAVQWKTKVAIDGADAEWLDITDSITREAE